MIKRYRLKVKDGFYCKLFNNYRFDGKCNEMACEFCDDYYDERRKVWWYHPESDSYFLETYKNMHEAMDESPDAAMCNNVDDRIKTRVVNVKHHTSDVFIGRGSKYGNPFRIGVHGDRKTVIDKFRDYLYNNDELQDAVLRLKGLRLGCFCSPLDCHGDVIAEFIENYRTVP